MASRTALVNQIRGLLSEYGIVIAKGIHEVRKMLPEILEDGENGLTADIREGKPYRNRSGLCGQFRNRSAATQ